MTGSLLPTVVWRAQDSNGLPLNGALLYTFLTGTTTPTPTYTTSSLGTPLANPVVADSSGLFPEIFLDPAVTYRFQLKTAGGSLVQDIDPFSVAPVIAAGGISASMLAAGAAASNLGFTPVNKAGDSLSGELKIAYTLSGVPDAKSVGFRGMPINTQDGNYTFGNDDPGKLTRHTDGSAYAWTIAPDATTNYPIGTVLPFRNAGAGVITLTRGAAVTLTISGNGTSKDVGVAQYGAGALIKEAANTWYVAGTGLS